MPRPFLKIQRPSKWLRRKPEQEPERTDPQMGHANDTLEQTKNPEKVTTSADIDDLWAKARQRLAQDKDMGPILEEASQILEDSGLRVGFHGAAEHQQLQSSLDAKLEELKQKELVVQVDDRLIKVREQLARVVRNVLVFKDLVSTAASASVPVAIVCAGMTVSLLLFIRAEDQQDSLLNGLEKTSDLIPRLCMMENLYLHSYTNLPDDFMERFKGGLVSLYCKVLEFQARALCFLQKNAFSRMYRNMIHEKWDALTESITGQEAEARNFTRLLDATERKSDREKITQQFERALERHRLDQMTLDRIEKMNRLIQLLYICPYRDRKDRIDNRVPGTCEWFTKHSIFQRWNQTKGPSLLWVSADPGCGKSVLSKYLVDEVLPTEKRTICYFFFRDDYPDQRRSTIALAGMLRQLFLAQPHLLSSSVLGRHDEEGEKLVGSFYTLWDIFKNVTASNDSHEIICVVDALDECQEDERKQLIRAITDFYLRSDNNCKLKFLLTSRPYGKISEEFRELEDQMPTIHLSGESEKESEEISREIDLVIAKRVHDISNCKGLEEHEQKFLQERLREIRNRTYLWLALTLDYIQDLDGFTKGKVRETMRSIPQTVDDAYEKILSKNKDRSTAERLLHIVLAAKRPLFVEELSIAIAMKREGQPCDDILESIEPTSRFKSTLRDACGLMLVIVDNKVYLLHQTVKEFLLQKSSVASDTRPSRSWKHAISVKESNKVLAEICAWHISAASAEASLSVLLNYSAVHWADHFREACFRPKDKLTMLACRLCVPGLTLYNTWTAVYKSDARLKFPNDPALLCIPALFGLSAVVQELLESSSVEVDMPDSEYGQTPLSWAAEKGHDAVVNLLLSTGKVNLDSKDSLYGQTPLTWAATWGHDAVIRLLLESKADVESKDLYGRTPLTWAAAKGYDHIVSLLLESKAEIETKDFQSHTPLAWAAGRGHDTVVSLLLSTGKVDIESRDSRGGTPLSWAAGSGCDTVVSLLLDRKADIESRNSHGRTPLSWAATSGYDTVMSLLLDRKADIESRDSHGRTPLSWAAGSGYDTVVSLLLDRKADIESRDSHGRTPLSWAAGNRNDTVVSLLLDRKADIESRDSHGRTPLSWAAERGYHPVVSLLLDASKVGSK